MRLPYHCLDCIFERIDSGTTSEVQPSLLEVRDDGAYVGTCSHGHDFSFAIRNLKYELLYEAGGVALLCGFYREAITSMATALERFYEFAINVLVTQFGVTEDGAATAWKSVSRQSERQLGAFYYLYVAAFRRPYPASGSQSMTELRNDVVHKGRIPSREEALKFAEHVYRTVLDVRRELYALSAAAVERVQALSYSKHAVQLAEHLRKAGVARSGMQFSYSVILNSWGEPEAPDDFVWRLEALAYRVSKSGLGILVDASPFTKFDPTLGDEPVDDDSDMS